MTRLATLTSLALLLTAGHTSAQNTMTSGRPSAVLTPDQCNEVWNREVSDSDTRVQADADSEIVNFAQIDTDAAQVDPNNDGTIDKSEFQAACGKGLVYKPPRVKE